MSGPGPREPPPEAGATGGEAGPEGAGGGDAALGEPGLSFTTTDLSLVEMTEVEYTQLQHILYSHMEAADGELEARLGSALLAGPGAGSGAAGSLAPAPPVYPVLCPPLAADAPCLGHVDFQELRMMLLGEAGAAEKTPGGADGTRTRADGVAKEGAGGAGPDGAPEARAKPTVRVRLEDRFNSMPAEPPAPRGAEPAESGVALNKCVRGAGAGASGKEGPDCRAGVGWWGQSFWASASSGWISEGLQQGHLLGRGGYLDGVSRAVCGVCVYTRARAGLVLARASVKGQAVWVLDRGLRPVCSESPEGDLEGVLYTSARWQF
jgi:hypothetical protein